MTRSISAVAALTRWVEPGAPGHDRRLPHDIVHGGADVVRRDTHALEHIYRRAIPLASNAQQEVFCGDIRLPHLHGFPQGILQHALHPRGEGQVAGDISVFIDGGDLTDVLGHPVMGDVQPHQSLGSQALVLRDEAQQDMFGAHVGLMERAGFVLGQDEHLPRFVRELLERHRGFLDSDVLVEFCAYVSTLEV